MHYYHQFLPQKIQPMSENMIVAGRAMPVAECDIDNLTDEMKNSPLFNQPFGLMLDALDDLKKNEGVYLLGCFARLCACWRELLWHKE